MINILPQDVVNQIAAGEVVERPASVIKELVENSIDAGSKNIKVYIKEFGTEKIQIVDDGSGIERADLERVFLKHATSKLEKILDLNTLHSYGFRGEALASISSVSKIVLHTKHAHDEMGSEVIYQDGKIVSIRPSSISQGTDISVLDLFSNVPARKKFLKAKATENKALTDIFNKFALSNPDIAFTLDIEGSTKHFPAEDSKARASQILKIDASNLIPILYDGQVHVEGFVVHPRFFLKSKASQFTFVNGRTINDSAIYKGVVDGYDTFLMKNQYPGFVVFITLDPSRVDVNVHPRKTEVRFDNPSDVYKSVKTAVNVNLVKALREETQAKLASLQEKPAEVADTNDRPPIESSSDNSGNDVSAQTFKLDDSPSVKQSDLDEFESFLHDEPVREKTKDSMFDTLEIKEPETVTEQALLFSSEVMKEQETPKMYLDLANATQLLNSYILTANQTSVLIIDQHAASERYYYEYYLKQLRSKKVTSKLLLFPEILTLGEYELAVLDDNRALFEEMGFMFEHFGSSDVKFTQVPEFVKMDNFSKVIERMLEDLSEHQELSNIKDTIFHEIAAILACHTAVRFGDKLNHDEIVKILKNLLTCEDPYNCPHGRPVIQDYSRYDIEKKFKRCGL